MGRLLVYVAGLALVLVVACNEPTEVSVFAPIDTLFHFDTVVVHDTVWHADTVTVVDTLIVTDTLFVPVIVTDTLFLPGLRIYCWLIKSDNRTPKFECDDGYRGPRI